jgi:NAD(P)-dependent dehydrogenase (short-subunit alcohol dehydrogenase family)
VTAADLAGRRIVVGGGTGDVGVEIVARLLAAGADVVVPVRNPAKAGALGSHARLSVIEGFPEDDAGVAALHDSLAATGPIHGAVAALGPWFHGPALTQLSKVDWDAMVAAALTSHFLFARAVVPVLIPRGQFILINGGAALAPVPHSGIVSILARAQTMLAEVLAAENPGIGVHTLMLRSIIATRARPSPDPSWITAAEVGDACAWLLTPQGRLTAGSIVTLNQKTPAES